MQAPDSARFNDPGPGPSPDEVVAAFREVHARSLHGFALLLTLGDRARAHRLATRALASGAGRIDELRHPERAAAWLRRQVVADEHRRVGFRRRPREPELLRELGADQAVMRAIAPLAPPERAALIASDIERLDRRDVASIVDRSAPALERLLRRARTRYYRAYDAGAPDGDVPDGPTVSRIQAIARRQMA